MGASLQVVLLLTLGYVLTALESPLLHSLHVGMYAPHLTLGIVLYLALTAPPATGAVAVFLLGLMRDGFSGGGLIGMHSEIYLLVYLLALLLSKRLDYRPSIMFMLVTGAASLLASGVFFVLSAIFDQLFDQFDLVLRLMVPQALIAAPFGAVVAGICGLTDRLTEKIEAPRSRRLL
jgi:rod shape-determining protein MreD